MEEVRLPNEDSPDHTLGIDVKSKTVVFGKWGIPVDTSGNPLGSDEEIELEDGTVIITIKKNTGLIL